MSDHLQEPGDDGDVVDQTEMDLTEGPAPEGVAGAGVLPEATPPGHPGASSPVTSAGEPASKGGSTAAGPESPTTGTGSGTGARRDDEAAPPTAPG